MKTIHLLLFLSLSLLVVNDLPARKSCKETKQLLRQSIEATRSIPFSGTMDFHRKEGEKDWHTKAQVIRFPSGEKWMKFLYPKALQNIILFQNDQGFWGTPMDRDERKQLDKNENVDTEIFKRAFYHKSIIHLLEPDNVDLLIKNYHIKTGKDEKIAHRPTEKLILGQRDKNRPLAKIWIDRETHMQLKYQRFSWKKEFKESFTFCDIDFSINFKERKPSTEGLNNFFSTSKEEKKEIELDFTPYKPKCLPTGFEEINQNKWEGRHGKTLHIVYSDGLAHLSIFQRRQT
ncbi:hypothetical protein GF373_06675, partial [bacterium]|nr:hypothetical protein [bacterium]